MRRTDTCQRTACASLPTHAGAVHLDPASDLYDGPNISMDALGHAERRAAYTLQRLLAAGSDVAGTRDEWRGMPAEARIALDTMVREIHRLKGQVAQVQVNADRQVHQAMAAALSCEQHGKDLARLEEQVDHFDKLADHNDQGRLALLGGLHQVGEFVRALRDRAKVGDQLPDTKAVAETIGKVIDKAHAAHRRAWSR